MGQYLSAPITAKDSQEGSDESLAYGLSAMQGWRVSMEDAHIAELDLDSLQTALFSVFDGHGGKGVALFCAKHLARELVSLESYKRGDLAAAISEAYYRMDELLGTQQGKQDLEALIGGAAGAESKGLFSDVEGQIHLDPKDPASPKQESTDDAEQPDVGSPPALLAAKLLVRANSTDEFRRSALQRHSVLPPAAFASASSTEEADADAIAPAAATRPPAPRKEGSKGKVEAVSEEEEEEEEVDKASGMGCTAVSVVVRGEDVVVANTGDSRCVLSRRGEARPLTLDHKPILYEEAQRIIKAGGFVRDNRINGALNVSRTIGDLDFKRNAELPHTEQMVVATPDVVPVRLQPGDEFLILACDGIWDVLSNQEAVDFVRRRLKQGLPLRQICEEMCDRCLAADLKGMCRGADNMSVIVVVFKKHADMDSIWSRMANLFRRRKSAP